MGSSLSEQERIGLEDVFLSISSSRNITQKWSNWGKNLVFNLNKKIIPSSLNISKNSKIWLQNSLKTNKITKLFTKIQKRRKI
ncbi:hypothetical protein [Sulfuricurvum sp.]|uniref:hypothetical protein n=1 Tax=Sulfuricurvum sp. TaxID=2025608 RepID=UPI003BB6F835